MYRQVSNFVVFRPGQVVTEHVKSLRHSLPVKAQILSVISIRRGASFRVCETTCNIPVHWGTCIKCCVACIARMGADVIVT